MPDDEIPPLAIAHIERPRPPWRDPSIGFTECGLALGGVADWITRAEAKERVQRLGRRRASFTLCQTCEASMHRYSWMDVEDTFEAQSLDVIGRDVERAKRGRSRSDPDDLMGDRVRAEYAALAELTEAHREEFEARVAVHLGEAPGVVPLAERRRRRR